MKRLEHAEPELVNPIERVERDPGGHHHAAFVAYQERWRAVREAGATAARAGLPETDCPYQRTGRVGDFHARLEWLAAWDLAQPAAVES